MGFIRFIAVMLALSAVVGIGFFFAGKLESKEIKNKDDALSYITTCGAVAMTIRGLPKDTPPDIAVFQTVKQVCHPTSTKSTTGAIGEVPVDKFDEVLGAMQCRINAMTSYTDRYKDYPKFIESWRSEPFNRFAADFDKCPELPDVTAQ